MSHTRTQILAAIKTALEASPNIGHVYAQRIFPTRQIWPTVLVYAISEDVQDAGPMASPREQLRSILLACKGFVRPDQDEEASEVATDDLAIAIEEALTSSAVIPERSLDLISTEWADEVINELPMPSVTLTYRIIYTTLEFVPEIPT